MTHTTSFEWKRLCWGMVCLVLVCAFVFNLSPIRAQAVLIYDDLILIGCAAVLVLGLTGIVLQPETDAQFAAIGQDLSDFMYDAAKKPESQISDVQVGVWLEDLGNAMDGKPGGPGDKISPSMWGVFITTQFMIWAKQFLDGKSVEYPSVNDNGVSFPLSRSVVPAGTPIPWITANKCITFSVDVWYLATYSLVEREDGKYSASRANYAISVDPMSLLPYELDSNGISKTSKSYVLIDETKHGFFSSSISSVIQASSLGDFLAQCPGYIEYNSTTVDIESLLKGVDPVLPNSSYMSPEFIEECIQENISMIESLRNWQADDPVSIPDVEYGNIMTENQTLTEAITQLQTQLSTGTLTLQQYLDSVSNGQGITINQTITPEPDPSVSGISSSVGKLVNFFTGTTYVQSPLYGIRFGDLFDLFPFNIPAGIYETINFWNAPAAAPTLSFPVPNMSGGKVVVDTYDINLSDIPGFDRLAAVIRAGELILFAIGLALVTRKVTKW